MPFHSNSEFKIRILGWGALDDDSGALRVWGVRRGEGGGARGTGAGWGVLSLLVPRPGQKGSQVCRRNRRCELRNCLFLHVSGINSCSRLLRAGGAFAFILAKGGRRAAPPRPHNTLPL